MLKATDYIQLFERANDPAIGYLRTHAYRFLRTKEMLCENIQETNGIKLLDVASHWLHNAVLYACDGFEVTGLDLAGREIANPSVVRTAEAFGIHLVPCATLQNPVELDNAPEGTFDIVMFAELIEHITFNPISLWQRLYRVLKEGGKVVVTTPNYHYLRGAVYRDLRQLLRGHSSGISISDLVEMQDYAPHWKEFTKKDIQSYFAKLSPDFKVVRAVYTDFYGWQPAPGLQKLLQRKVFPRLLNATMYVEVELSSKRSGIAAATRC